LHPWDLEMSTKTCSNNMVSPNDHVVMNHHNQTPNKWHMRTCSLQARRSPAAVLRVAGVRSLSPVVSRPPGDSPSPRWGPYTSRLYPWATMANARRSHARGVDAAACGIAGLRPSHDRWGARATNALARGQPRASARRITVKAKSAARGGAAAFTFPAHGGVARRPAHRSVARRRRAQGHEVSRSFEPLRATSRAIRLACNQAQGATHCVATAVLAHAEDQKRPGGRWMTAPQ
jgi:hypothetical protein